jgi:biotin operon repressor
MTTLEQRYAALTAALPTVRPGTLRESLSTAWGVTRGSVGHILLALRSAGYDLTAYDALAKLSLHVATKGRIGDPDPTFEKRYAVIMAAIPNAPPGQLTDTMRVVLGYADRTSVNKLIKAMRKAGLDMSVWDAAAKRSRADSPAMKQAAARAVEARKAKAKAKATEERGLSASQAKRTAPRVVVDPDPIAPRVRTRDHLDQWLADMRSVVNEAAPLDRLMMIWDVPRRRVYDRIGNIRETGVDMTWWSPAPSRAFKPDARRPQPVTIPRLMAPVESPAYRPAVPWTLQGLALVVDVPVAKVCERAERMGFWPHPSTMVDARTARLILWTLGFTPSAAPQAA